MSLHQIQVNANTTMLEILEQLDRRLYLVGAGPPQGTIEAQYQGQRYFDQLSAITYICINTDQTAAGSSWMELRNSTNEGEFTNLIIIADDDGSRWRLSINSAGQAAFNPA